MAALGTLTVRSIPGSSPRVAVTDYNVERGSDLGPIGIRVVPDNQTRITPLTGYIVRQTRILFRQLWPAYGQRFPQ